MRIVVVFPAPFGPRKPWISPGFTSRLTPSTAVKLPYVLTRSWMAIIGEGGTAQATGSTSIRRWPLGNGIDSGAMSAGLPADEDRNRARRQLEIEHLIFSRPISGRIAACLSRPPRASRRCVASAGN